MPPDSFLDLPEQRLSISALTTCLHSEKVGQENAASLRNPHPVRSSPASPASARTRSRCGSHCW